MSRLLQVVLAIVGLVLTAVLQNASNRNAEVQNAQGLVQLYTQEISAALETCNPAMLQVAQDSAIELNQLRARGILRGSTDFEAHVLQVSETMPNCVASGASQTGGEPTTVPGSTSPPAADVTTATPVAPELVAQSRNLELRGMERSVVLSAPSSSSAASADRSAARSFAVLASYAVSDPATFDGTQGAAAHFNQLTSAAAAEGLQVQVYRTAVSNHFAIVIPAETEAAANDLVQRARRMGWAPDAFVQVERGWVQCSEPGTPGGLRSCAGSAINRETSGRIARQRTAPN
jgi:hypothetical protein